MPIGLASRRTSRCWRQASSRMPRNLFSRSRAPFHAPGWGDFEYNTSPTSLDPCLTECCALSGVAQSTDGAYLGAPPLSGLTQPRLSPGWQDQTVQTKITDSGPLAVLLESALPPHLYHYTGPSGAVGVLTSQTLWAGRPADMNDATEQRLARAYARRKLN